MKIGFIGTGIMGKSMIRNLRKNGFHVCFYARNMEKVNDLVEEGFSYYDEISKLAANSDVIITIVGYPSDVREIYLNPNHILDHAKKGTITIDMTTSGPSLQKEIYQLGLRKGIRCLDCPVTGGDSGARNQTLTIFAGGDFDVYEQVKDILKAMGKTVAYMGESSMGQHAKLANQVAIAGSISGMAEAVAYMRKSGLPVKETLEMLSTGSAGSWQMQHMASRALQGDLGPGFYVKHFIKDLKLAKEEANLKELDLKMVNTVLAMFLEMAEKGYENFGTQALVNYYE